MTGTPVRARRIAIVLAACVGCAAPSTSVESALEPAGGAPARTGAAAPALDPASLEAIDVALVAADAAATRTRERAARAPDDGTLQLEAARALMLAARLRHEKAIRTRIDPEPPTSLDELRYVEEELPEPWRTEVRVLTEAGMEHAELAAALLRANAPALHQYALHLAMHAQSIGVLQALLGGYGSRIADAMRATVEVDGGVERGAPLLLLGRFLCEAPWPFGDGAEGLELLGRGFDLGPSVSAGLYLGDALWDEGEPAAARASWESALSAPCEGNARVLAPFERHRVRLRLELTRS